MYVFAVEDNNNNLYLFCILSTSKGLQRLIISLTTIFL